MNARASTCPPGGTDARPERDKVIRNSYDINDRRAQPGRKIGNGSAEHGGAFKAALLYAAEQEIIRQHREGYRGPCRLQWTDHAVLKHSLKFLRYHNGDFTVDYGTMSGNVGKKDRKAAIRAIERLEFWGFICHVRRSELRDDIEKGQPGARRKQAPNFYYFNLQKRLPVKAWQDFWQALKRNLERARAGMKKQAHMFIRSFNSLIAAAPRLPKRGQDTTLADIAAIKDPKLQGLLRDIGRQNGFFEGGSASP